VGAGELGVGGLGEERERRAQWWSGRCRGCWEEVHGERECEEEGVSEGPERVVPLCACVSRLYSYSMGEGRNY
jgi:hypothetical protein